MLDIRPQLGFQGRDEAFVHGIVQSRSGPSHIDGVMTTSLSLSLAQRKRAQCIERPDIRMVDQSQCGLPPPHGHLESVCDEFGPIDDSPSPTRRSCGSEEDESQLHKPLLTE